MNHRKNEIETMGFVGFGSMGQFMAKTMNIDCAVVAHDPTISAHVVNGVPMVDLHQVATSDVIVLATPAAALEPTLAKLERLEELRYLQTRQPVSIDDGQLIVDICSVKEYPTNTINRFWPGHPDILLTHPLFGPQSSANGIEGKTVVVTESRGAKAQRLCEAWRSLGLRIDTMTAEQHDRAMVPFALAKVIGRVVNTMRLRDTAAIRLLSANALLDLAALDEVESEALFQTIVDYNPHVQTELDRFAEIFASVRSDRQAIDSSVML